MEVEGRERGRGRKGWFRSPSLVHLLQQTRPHRRPSMLWTDRGSLPRFTGMAGAGWPAEGRGQSGRWEDRREAGGCLRSSAGAGRGCGVRSGAPWREDPVLCQGRLRPCPPPPQGPHTGARAAAGTPLGATTPFLGSGCPSLPSTQDVLVPPGTRTCSRWTWGLCSKH